MSIEKHESHQQKPRDVKRPVAQPASAGPAAPLELVGLELQDEDFGGDPYNRTGQFCVIDLKNKEQ